jgi:pimeloyl-ACP methyl ester carboxylesterase
VALSSGSVVANATAGPADAPSVVIVHGAFADGSDWAKVVARLQARGLHVQVVQNGLDSLQGDVSAARRAIDAQPGKVVLVGHSWGGTVITEAGQNDKVASLVYVAAFAPDANQSTNDMTKGLPPPPWAAKVIADRDGYLRLSPEAMAHDFAQDVPARQTAVMAATQGPIQGKAFDEKTSVAAWETRPSWYVVTTKDHMIAPDLQRAMARKIGATVMTLSTSHVPQQSQPGKVAEAILAAVSASTQKQ